MTCSPSGGATLPIGTTTVNCSATNAYGIASAGAFSVIVRDTTPPTLTVPAAITVHATAAAAPVSFSTMATDLVDGTDVVTCTPASGSVFPLGTTAVTCSATDARGNTSSGSFTVTRADRAPVCSAARPTVSILWPPNHKLVTVGILGVTTDDRHEHGQPSQKKNDRAS